MIKTNNDNVFAIASSNNQCQARSAVSLCPNGGAATRIPRATTRMTPPDAHHYTKEANIAISTYVEKWKNKYEDSERKHKAHLLKAEKSKREYDDLQRRFNIVSEERNHLFLELSDRERELNKLRTVSEKLFKEYQQLKNQHDIDTGVMQKVMQQAGEWYKQNKQLKRRSTALLQALPTSAVEIDFTDSNDNASESSTNEEVEFLKQTVSELSAQTAELQTDLNNAKLQEFEAHETNVSLAQELEQEREKTSVLERELSTLKSEMERHVRLSKLLLDEVTALKENADTDRQMAETYKSEARDAKSRVRALTHQSALLMGELDVEERTAILLGELDNLRVALEEQAERHRVQLGELQLKVAEKQEETDIILWEEKIRLAEEDAQKALERAEASEKRVAELTRTVETLRSNQETTPPKIAVKPQLSLEKRKEEKVAEVKLKRSNLMSRISYFENAGDSKVEKEIPVVKEEEIEEVEEPQQQRPPTTIPPPHFTPPPPPSIPPPPAFIPPAPPVPPPPPPPPAFCPPPPPPPPPAPPAFNGGVVEDMATMLQGKQGTLKRSAKQNGAAGGAIDAIVDQIKGGKFHLKSSNQSFMEKKPKDDQPEAVKEMLNILGTLRKRRSRVVLTE